MTISSSISQVGIAQADGRCHVVEIHTDHLGNQYRQEYGPVFIALVDISAIRAARAIALEDLLEDREFRDRLQRVAPLNLQYQTGAQFSSRMREAYRTSSKEVMAALAWWIVEMISAGNITDAQVRTAFGMTAGEYTTFKSAKLVPAHDSWASVQAAAGE